MKHFLKEYHPHRDLSPFINSYWSFRNSGNRIPFPVVPDGCSDIIFYLNQEITLEHSADTFISGVMDVADIVMIPPGIALFGVRFHPGVLSALLQCDMFPLRNRMVELKTINKAIHHQLQIDSGQHDEEIINQLNRSFLKQLTPDLITHRVFKAIQKMVSAPDLPVKTVAIECGYSRKQLERLFKQFIGITPKKFAAIIRFQRAHREITRNGLNNLIEIAYGSGYCDQAHFNKVYKKLTGFSPTAETMSILYNTEAE